MATRLTALKVGYKGEIHRVRVELGTFSFGDLTALFESTYELSPGSFVVQYTDPEGDCVNVTSEEEYAEACRVFLAAVGDLPASLRFSAISRSHVVFQENVADPVLKALEKLVETLNAAMEKVKHEQWAQKAQSTAQTGLDQTNVALKAAAKEARESLSAARQSLQDIPFDQLVKETTEGIKSAAEGISEFAKEVVGEIKKYNAQPETEPVAAETVAVAEAFEGAPQSAASSDSEWEEVAEQAPVEVAIPVAEEVHAAVEPVAPVASEEELKWAAELAMIRDILPVVETARVIDQLEQCNGNVQVVVNALMEEM